MVQASRETPRSGGIRRLNVPRSIDVQTNSSSRLPTALKEHGGAWRTVASLEDTWRVEDEWWREPPLARAYYQALLEDDRMVTFFLDEMTGRWHTIRMSELSRSA
jgi:hypothetical protein